MHERGESNRKERNPKIFLRFIKFRHSEFVGPRMKVHLLEKGYAWVPKTRDFVEDSSKEFGKSKVSGLGCVHWTF